MMTNKKKKIKYKKISLSEIRIILVTYNIVLRTV